MRMLILVVLLVPQFASDTEVPFRDDDHEVLPVLWAEFVYDPCTLPEPCEVERSSFDYIKQDDTCCDSFRRIWSVTDT